MNLADVAPGLYRVRGDVLEVTAVEPGASARSATVRFTLREKGRPRSALDVGDSSTLGIVNFACWATPLTDPHSSPT